MLFGLWRGISHLNPGRATSTCCKKLYRAPATQNQFSDWEQVSIPSLSQNSFSQESSKETRSSSSSGFQMTTSNTQSFYSSPAANSNYKIQTVCKTEVSQGTSLNLSSSNPTTQESFDDFYIARNIFPESQGSLSSSTTEVFEYNNPTTSMMKIGLSRKIVKISKKNSKKRYPTRNKTSPVRWWMGERTVYNDSGFLIAKDVRQ